MKSVALVSAVVIVWLILAENNYHLLLTNENLKSTSKISPTHHHPTILSSIQGRPIHARRDGDSHSHDYLGVGIQKIMAITAKITFVIYSADVVLQFCS